MGLSLREGGRRLRDREEERKKLFRRSLKVLVLAQIFGGGGLTAGVTVGALLARDLTGTEQAGGLPTALFTAGSASAAYMIGRLSQKNGRRVALSLSYFIGALGAAAIVAFAALGHLAGFFTALFFYGAGLAAILQGRYGGADLAPPGERATAVSRVLLATTLGAMAGPNLAAWTGQEAARWGLPPLTGPFILASLSYFMAAFILFTFLRPDPLLWMRAYGPREEGEEGESPPSLPAQGVTAGAVLMVLAQLVMVAIMTMTPLYMEHHGHGLPQVGLVISLHIGAMYLPSLFTGILADRFGAIPMGLLAAWILLLSGLLAAYVPGTSLGGLAVALGLLGLGWNLGLIAGSTLVSAGVPSSQRARTQGTVDVLVALSGASGGAFSGILMGHSSYGLLSLVGGLISLAALPFLRFRKDVPSTRYTEERGG